MAGDAEAGVDRTIRTQAQHAAQPCVDGRAAADKDAIGIEGERAGAAALRQFHPAVVAERWIEAAVGQQAHQ